MFFGGNGARLFSWAARASYDKQHKINDLFRAMLINGMGTEDKSKSLNIEISDNLNMKIEAAYGLLYYEPSKDNAPQVPAEYEEGVFAGEVFYGSDDVEYGEETLMDTGTLTSGLGISCKLKNLGAFIELYNQESKKLGMKTIDIKGSNVMDKVCSLAQGMLDEFRYKKPDDVPLEPVFILCLKALIQELADDWRDRYR